MKDKEPMLEQVGRYIVNEDGEVIGHTSVKQLLEEAGDKPLNDKQLEQIGAILTREHMTMRSLDERVAALNDQYKRIKARHESRVKYVLFALGGKIKATVKGRKLKSLTTLYGDFKSRLNSGRDYVEDEEKALAWVVENRPDLIKQSFNKNDMLAAIKGETDEVKAAAGIGKTADSTSWTFDSGIDKSRFDE